MNPRIPGMSVQEGAEAAVSAIKRRQEKEAEKSRASLETWRAFGERKNLVLREDRGSPARKLEGRVADIPCSLQITVDADGWAHTLVTAEATTTNDVIVTLHPSPTGFLDNVRQALFGDHDVKLGDNDFDRHFLIHAVPKEAAPQLLRDELRHAIRAWCGNHLELVKYDRGTVYVQSTGVETDEAALEQALAIAVGLAAWQPPSAAGPDR